MQLQEVRLNCVRVDDLDEVTGGTCLLEGGYTVHPPPRLTSNDVHHHRQNFSAPRGPGGLSTLSGEVCGFFQTSAGLWPSIVCRHFVAAPLPVNFRAADPPGVTRVKIIIRFRGRHHPHPPVQITPMMAEGRRCYFG